MAASNHLLLSPDDSDLLVVLSRALTATEACVEEMVADRVNVSVLGYVGNNNTGERGAEKPPEVKTRSGLRRNSAGGGSRRYSRYLEGIQIPQLAEGRAVYDRAADGSLTLAEPGPVAAGDVQRPVSVHQISTELLYSGVAVWPGCYDDGGHPLVVVYCRNQPTWEHDAFSSQQLARLLLYYHNIPSPPSRLALVVDARGTTPAIINTLLETLYVVEAVAPATVAMVHVLADRVAQMLIFKSPAFRPKVDIKMNLLMSSSALYKAVPRHKLPAHLGGTHNHNHTHWVRFRLKLEPFVENCRRAAKFLVSIMNEMSADSQHLPSSIEECERLISSHERLVRRALDDPLLLALQTGAENSLAELAADAGNQQGDSAAVSSAHALYRQVHEAMVRLVRLADRRLHKIDTCLHARQFEQQAGQVIQWLCTEGEELLSRHGSVGDNLKAVRAQQRDFDKLYFNAMSQIEKGHDMVEEASLLAQTGDLDQVAGVKDVSKELRSRMKSFTERLEDLRDNIESTAQCYHLLDKSYEWAVDAMRFVSSLHLSPDLSGEEVGELLGRLEVYQREHPPVHGDTFATMLSLAERLQNAKLLEQCKVAQSRCLETDHLFRQRFSSLRKARQQLGGGSSPGTAGGSGPPSAWNPGPSPHPAPSSASSAVGPSGDTLAALRRRSYAGKPSAPLYSPTAAAFKDHLRDMNLSEYEEHLFQEGLITEDMSDRIVANIPKGLSRSTLNSSRESLRGSQDNLAQPPHPAPAGGSREDLTAAEKSNSFPRDAATSTSGTMTSSASMVTLGSKHNHRPPHRKMMRKANSMVLPDVTTHSSPPGGGDGRRGNLHTLSMVTGSSDSLPSLPEEDALTPHHGVAAGDDPRRLSPAADPAVTSTPGRGPAPAAGDKWSPVPVNTHLMFSRQRNPLMHQSMADLREAETEVKRRRTVCHILSELVATERDYVQSLGFIIDHYVPEILKDDVPQVLRGKRHVIFGNLEKIYEFHSQCFMKKLAACENNPFHVANSFLQHETDFYLYAMYNKNKPKADALMAEYGSAFFRNKQRELGDKMDLASYLLKPVQRMGKYALLLKQLLAECPVAGGPGGGDAAGATDGDSDLRRAYDNVRFQLRHGNDLLAMDALTGCDVNLSEQGMLMRQDAFLVWQGRKKSFRHAFLFEEMVVFAKTKRSASGHDAYVYKSSIKTSDMGLTESVGDSGYRFELWFRKRTMRDPYVLQAASTDTKAAWVREISRLLWKQAIKNRASRMAEMARMGIGTKPCLDLKTSADNINDRLVNINISAKRPRARNSIAVSSTEHLKNGTKRPHSLISLSSASSSSSSSTSHSSGYGVILSNQLASMLESPYEDQEVPRGGAASSNESGIEADVSSHSSPVHAEACTQTTLRRPAKKHPATTAAATTAAGGQVNGDAGCQTQYSNLQDEQCSVTCVENVVCLDGASEENSHLVSTNV